MEDTDFKTETMAKVYVNQGHYEKAAEIYKHLIELEPDRPDIAQALAEVKKKQYEKEKSSNADLTVLFEKWLELMFSYNRLQCLKKLKGKLAG